MPLGWFATNIGRRFGANDKEGNKQRLMLLQAGYEAVDAVQTFRAARMLALVTLPLIVLAFLPLIKPDIAPRDTAIAIGVAGALGLLIPSHIVGSRRKKRQDAIRASMFPTCSICCWSAPRPGSASTQQSCASARRRCRCIRSKVLLQMNSEMRAGRQRADAFRGFGERCEIEEVNILVNLLIQVGPTRHEYGGNAARVCR